ncbi:MAG: acetyl-CoA decarbonylase/synthase complex subunit gamma [Acidobacteria bacterium]|nr:acetyl-CoA decarbonylase/synthase complex subunit gamma [Acidobacteriota bacterium]
MALSGLEIFKLLPKTNCKECGVPTCMAFAMKLAQKKADLGECPHASEEARAALGAASKPPIRLVKIGVGARALEVGNETVMFRHEKTFFHQTGLAIRLNASEDEETLVSKIREIENYTVDRVGEQLKADLLFLSQDEAGKDAFLKLIGFAKEHSTKGVILDSRDRESLTAGLEILKADRPAVFLSGDVSDGDFELAKNRSVSLIITGESFESLESRVEKAKKAGIEDLILNLKAPDLGRQFQNNTILRRSALKKNYEPFGYPLLTMVEAENGPDRMAKASVGLCKYASIIVLPRYDKALLYTLFALRQNIFTDPQKPIQVEPKLYSIGDPTPESPVFLTTNFSLTFFLVSGEIENSGTSAHLVVCDCEGQSVLTAWAAGKFTGETIAKFIREIKLEEQVKTRRLIIPGFVSQISGDLEEKLPGWEILVGCQEAADIPSFVKSVSIA